MQRPYKAFRERIRGDRLIKFINLMLRSAECGMKLFFPLSSIKASVQSFLLSAKVKENWQ